MNKNELRKLKPIVEEFSNNVKLNGRNLEDAETHDRYHELYDMVEEASGDPKFSKYVQPIKYWGIGGGDLRLWDTHAAKILASSKQLIAYLNSVLDNTSSESESKSELIRILLLSSNPLDTPKLNLDDEFRSIERELRLTDLHSKFDIRQYGAVKASDLPDYLLNKKPDIVHFSGHGNIYNEIIFQDENGISQPVSVATLENLFSIFRGKIRCVVLNACYSITHAEAIANSIECVIGIPSTINNKIAISFTCAFYRGLGYGLDLETSFRLGLSQIQIENMSETEPKLIAKICDPKTVKIATK